SAPASCTSHSSPRPSVSPSPCSGVSLVSEGGNTQRITGRRGWLEASPPRNAGAVVCPGDRRGGVNTKGHVRARLSTDASFSERNSEATVSRQALARQISSIPLTVRLKRGEKPLPDGAPAHQRSAQRAGLL